MFFKLVADLQLSLKTPSTGNAITDITNHATLFSFAVDSYVKSLIDPATRPPLLTSAPLIIPPIVAIAAMPGSNIVMIDALKTATQYAIGVYIYTAAIVINPSPIYLQLGGIRIPPGIPTMAKLIDLGVLSSIQEDFFKIFSTDLGPLEKELLTLIKAFMMASAIQKAFTTKTNVIISGMDSTPPPPANIGPQPFYLSGPLS